MFFTNDGYMAVLLMEDRREELMDKCCIFETEDFVSHDVHLMDYEYLQQCTCTECHGDCDHSMDELEVNEGDWVKLRITWSKYIFDKSECIWVNVTSRFELNGEEIFVGELRNRSYAGIAWGSRISTFRKRNIMNIQRDRENSEEVSK